MILRLLRSVFPFPPLSHQALQHREEDSWPHNKRWLLEQNLSNNQKWQVKERRWWPLSVTWTRSNWRSLSLCLESASTTHCRKRLTTNHFSETHYKRWANLKALPLPPQLVQIAVDLQRYPLQGCFSGDDAVKIIFFLKGFLSILSPWQLLTNLLKHERTNLSG